MKSSEQTRERSGLGREAGGGIDSDTRLRSLARSSCRRFAGQAAFLDDATQDVMFLLHRKGHYVEPRALSAWIHETSRKVCASYLRKQSVRQRHESRAGREFCSIRSRGNDLNKPPSHSDVAIEQALAGLTDKQRDALRLRYWEDLTPQEIAAKEGISHRAAKDRLAGGSAKARKLLTKLGVSFPLWLPAQLLRRTASGIRMMRQACTALGRGKRIAAGAVVSLAGCIGIGIFLNSRGWPPTFPPSATPSRASATAGVTSQLPASGERADAADLRFRSAPAFQSQRAVYLEYAIRMQSQALRTPIEVDWKDLVRAGVNPTTPISCDIPAGLNLRDHMQEFLQCVPAERPLECIDEADRIIIRVKP